MASDKLERVWAWAGTPVTVSRAFAILTLAFALVAGLLL